MDLSEIVGRRVDMATPNSLTLDKIDPRAKIPDFKMAAVQLEKLDRAPTMLEEQGAIKDPTRYVH